MPDELIKLVHQTVKLVEENIIEMKFNVAVSKIMILIGELQIYENMIDKSMWEIVSKIIAPFAPYIAEEMWLQMGNTNSIHLEKWPEYETRYVVEHTVEIIVEFNGKVRGTITVPKGSKQQYVEDTIRKNTDFKEFTISSEKIFFVADKVINFT
jgi:leucyl-tRNA synthetase